MKTNKLQLFNIFITVVVLAFVVLHFIPYFSFKGEGYSIFNFIWWHPSDLKKFGREIYGATNFDMNQATTLLVLSFVAALGLLVLNFTKPDSLAAELVGLLWSAFSLIGYPASNILRLQAEATENSFIMNPGLYWPIFILILIGTALILARLVFFIPVFVERIKKKRTRGY